MVAIVQLLFGDPLQPLLNGITDGKLGPLTVVSKFDINLSMCRCDILFLRSAASTSDRRRLILFCESQRRCPTTELQETGVNLTLRTATRKVLKRGHLRKRAFFYDSGPNFSFQYKSCAMRFHP